ncbi:MAG: hypothetical protein JW384_04117 [Nitrosomonadaceae bacterium]|nr:hypothetical protein [Nitrosomonadaceae bacterium]
MAEVGTPRSVCRDEKLLLVNGLDAACADKWHSQPVEMAEHSTPIFLATDSSKPMWAYLFWTSYRSCAPEEAPRSGNWIDFGDHPNINEATIFVKELLTAVIAIEALCKRYRRRKIVLFIDNTAAAGVVRRLASSTAYGNELAKRLDVALSVSACSVTVVTLTSEQNPADSPTRKKPLCRSRVESMWKVWDNYQRGLDEKLGHLLPGWKPVFICDTLKRIRYKVRWMNLILMTKIVMMTGGLIWNRWSQIRKYKNCDG